MTAPGIIGMQQEAAAGLGGVEDGEGRQKWILGRETIHMKELLHSVDAG